MSVALGIKVAILAPTVFFLVSYFWSTLMRGHLSSRILSQTGTPPGDKATRLVWIIVHHHFASIYAESVFLFAVNGLIVTLELADAITGTILTIAGLLLSVSGLIYMSVHEEIYSFPRSPRFFPVLFILVFSLAFGELTFMGSYEYTAPEMSAILSFVAGAITACAFYLYYKRVFRIVYVPPRSPASTKP